MLYKNQFFFLTGLWLGFCPPSASPNPTEPPDDDFDDFETGHIGPLAIWTVAEVSLSTQEIKKKLSWGSCTTQASTVTIYYRASNLTSKWTVSKVGTNGLPQFRYIGARDNILTKLKIASARE